MTYALPEQWAEPQSAEEWREYVAALRREVVAAREAAERRSASEIHRLRCELAQAQAHIIALRARVYERPLREDPALRVEPNVAPPFNGPVARRPPR